MSPIILAHILAYINSSENTNTYPGSTLTPSMSQSMDNNSFFFYEIWLFFMRSVRKKPTDHLLHPAVNAPFGWMQKHAYTHTTKYIWLFLIIITITLTRRDSSSSCKVYSLHALKKPCQFKLLKYSFLNTHFKWVHSKPILKCQIHTRLCQKHTKFTQTQMLISVNTNSWMCISLWDLWNDVSWRWWQHTTNGTQPGLAPSYFFSLCLGRDLFKCGILWHVCSQKETQDCNCVQKQHLYRK